MTKEVWRPIPEHAGYEASNLGRIRSLRLGREKVLSASRKSNGYLHLGLGKGVTRTVHRLVAAAFLGPCPPGNEVCHINGDRTDNRPENLRYDTRRGNLADMEIHGTLQRGKDNPSTILSEGQVIEIKRLLSNGRSTTSIAHETGVKRHNIDAIKRGLAWAWLGLEAS